jgi:16S rRNA G527 N7-methylase RsmG
MFGPRQKLESYASLLLNWNKQNNLISREIQTEDDLMENHIIPWGAHQVM